MAASYWTEERRGDGSAQTAFKRSLPNTFLMSEDPEVSQRGLQKEWYAS